MAGGCAIFGRKKNHKKKVPEENSVLVFLYGYLIAFLQKVRRAPCSYRASETAIFDMLGVLLLHPYYP
ncbi:hypothetical protein SDJN02_03089, partial [Cucurbita argyrosperma subsp. argyrosperma]